MIRPLAGLERKTLRGLEEFGFAGALFCESIYWTIFGRSKKQPVRLRAVLGQMIQIGMEALPIATVLSATIGVMLALQSLYTLGLFGAESFATVGIALSVVREFAPLIIGILIAEAKNLSSNTGDVVGKANGWFCCTEAFTLSRLIIVPEIPSHN